MERYRIEGYTGRRDEKLIGQLVAVWNISVRTSHDFLTEEDIDGLIPQVKAALRGIEHLIIVWEGHIPVGFMGIQERKIEMLFLSLSCIGKGIGKKLIGLATGRYAAEYVDVNEQNVKARGFSSTWASAPSNATKQTGRGIRSLYCTCGLRNSDDGTAAEKRQH